MYQFVHKNFQDLQIKFRINFVYTVYIFLQETGSNGKTRTKIYCPVVLIKNKNEALIKNENNQLKCGRREVNAH